MNYKEAVAQLMQWRDKRLIAVVENEIANRKWLQDRIAKAKAKKDALVEAGWLPKE